MKKRKCVTLMCKHPVASNKLGVCATCYVAIMRHKDTPVKEMRELIRNAEVTVNRLQTVMKLRRKIDRREGGK